MTGEDRLTGYRLRYLAAVSDGDAAMAQTVIDGALAAGIGEAQICLEILAPAQVDIGHQWLSGDIGIAQEHLATTITLRVLDSLRARRVPRPGNGLRVVISPVDGDQHNIGGRFVAEFFAMDGWDVDFLGQATPPDDLAAFVGDRRADLVALSATMPDYQSRVRETTQALRALGESAPKILIGGHALSDVTSDAAEELGCDAIARDAQSAVSEGRRLLGLGTTRPTIEQQLAAVGAGISEMRSRRGMTQKQLADACGLDRTYISLVENGKQNLSLGALSRIAEALDTPMADLIALRGSE